MPQLLHFLRVDEQTRLSAPVIPSNSTEENVSKADSVDAGEEQELPLPEGGRAFFNKSDNVRFIRPLLPPTYFILQFAIFF